MNVLLDTHIVLWWLDDDDRLGKGHRDVLKDKNHLCFVSAASIWEISIKMGLGKIEMPAHYLTVLKKQGFHELPVTWQHTHHVSSLPAYHKDPFDRLLIAQAQVESLVLLTVDDMVKSYPIQTL